MPDNQMNPNELGDTLGRNGAETNYQTAEAICGHERARIELGNAARVRALQAEIALYIEEEDDLKARLHLAPRLGDARSTRSRAAYYSTVAALLVVGSFFFSLIAFAPFRLGWKASLYCVAIAIVAPFLVEQFLERWGETSATVLKAVTLVAASCAVAGLMLLAVVRGDVLAHEIKDTDPVVLTANGDAASLGPVPATPPDSFYDRTVSLLRLLMLLLAVAMELGAGLALHQASMLRAHAGEDPDALKRKLGEVHQAMIERLTELTTLGNEGASFEQKFWRDYYASLLTQTVRRALPKVLGAVIALLLILPPRVSAAERLDLVVLVDLSQSVGARSPDGKTELDKNLEAVSAILATLPAGTRVTIAGITDHSFVQPYILLSAQMGDDPGYFGERLARARGQVTAAWRARAKTARRDFPHTDILGALLLASQLFAQSPPGNRRGLIIFSDMRQTTNDLNLEGHSPKNPATPVATLRSRGLLANLDGVEVSALGVDGAGKSIAQWNALKEFWSAYFNEAHSRLGSYAALREIPR